MGIGKKLALGAAALPAAYGAFRGIQFGIHELWTKKVMAPPEIDAMPLPGDDLVKDPNGYPLLRQTLVRELDAPAEEVWKYIYQMDAVKAGYYSFVTFERMFTMNVNNTYTLQEMWQDENAKKPGDFWAWGWAGFGAEVADIVPGKYVVWYADTTHPSSAPGSCQILMPGMDYLIWNWTNALEPIDGGKRCRMYVRVNAAWGPQNALTREEMDIIMAKGGDMMTRKFFETLEACANHKKNKSIWMQLVERAVANNHFAPDELQFKVAFPEVRWAREFPRVEDQRAPITDDPNWPPAPGTQYVPPIEENNAKKGWAPDTPAQNKAKALAKQDELMRVYGLK